MNHFAKVVILSTIPVAAKAHDFIVDIQNRMLPIYNVQKSISYNNTATKALSDTLSLSTATADINISDKTQAIIPQQGTGDIKYSIGAKSFMHLEPESTVWGGAVFSTGKTRDIRLSDCIDYELIAPYVSGDETGGDLSFRCYDFGGGYTKDVGNGLSLSAELKYRAEIAWRAVDPRIKTIVSDIDLSIGAAYRVTTKRALGVTASIRSYTQNCELEFYNPLNDIDTYPFTGLGTFYKRFTGNTNKSSGHSGMGYGINIDYISLCGTGLQLSVGSRALRVNEMLRDFNNITLAYTDTYNSAVRITYGYMTSQLRLMPTLALDYSYRLGTENLFGTAAGASYDKIGSRTSYLRETACADITLPVESRINNSYLTLTPNIRWYNYSESMTAPRRSLEYRHIIYGVSTDYSLIASKRWLLNLACGYSHRQHIDSSINIPSGGTDSTLDKWVYTSFEMCESNAECYNISAQVSRSFGKIAGCLCIGYEHVNITSINNCKYFNTSINILF